MVDYGYEEACPDISKYAAETNEESRCEANPSTTKNKYGYVDAAPDRPSRYGCGDAAPDASDYGYGEAIPDTKNYVYADASPETNKYDYEDAAPDTADCDYAPHPQHRRVFFRRSASDSERDYGYGDATGDEAKPKRHSSSSSEPRMGRRSSMKQEGGTPRRSSISFKGEVSNILPGHKRPQRRRISISFNESTEIKEVEPVRDLTDRPEELWFQKSEFGAIREKAKRLTTIARESQNGSPAVERKKLCFRGLESHINSSYVAKEQNLAWRSVFYEQYHQRRGEDFDDEIVASLYEIATMPSRARALERAAGDSKDAAKYTRGVRNAMRRHSIVY